jgi:hypothetical protein
MSAPPSLRWHALALPRHGNAADEYEDAFAAAPAAGRFAVADGASESSFAAPWARLLVESFAAAPPRRGDEAGWLAPLSRDWADEVGRAPLPWYAEVKRDQGAFATFLGLVFGPPRRDRAGRWRAVAVGDSCLFRVRQDRLLRPFPVSRSADFGNRPDLIGSRSPAAARWRGARGRWRPGDRFLLMTDALARWFLAGTEAGARPWEALARLPTGPGAEAAFAGWVGDLRRDGALRNDDVTLICIDVGPRLALP